MAAIDRPDVPVAFNHDDVPDVAGLPPGRYYMRCVHAKAVQSQTRDPGYELTWECLHGERAGQQIRDWQYLSWGGDPKHAMAQKCKLLVRECGLITPGRPVMLSAQSFIGKQLWVTVEAGKPYVDPATGQQKPGFPQIGFRGYELGAAPPDLVPTAGTIQPTAAAAPPPAAPAGVPVPAAANGEAPF